MHSLADLNINLSCILSCLSPYSLVPSPPPRQGEAWYTLFVYARNIFRKKLHALLYTYVEDYTNQEYRAFFEIDSSNDLTCRSLLGYIGGWTWLTFTNSNYGVITNWSWILHNKASLVFVMTGLGFES